MRTNSIFLKAIFISFSIHILGLSLFSIVLPGPLKKIKPIEVVIYPSLETRQIRENINFVSKKIEENIGSQKIKTEEEVPSMNIKNITSKDIVGEKEYITPVKLDLDVEKAEYKISSLSLPVPVLNLPQNNPSEDLIEGPAGSRKIIYREKIDYPLWAQQKGIEGKVKIKFWVNPEGKIFNTEISLSSGNPEIDFYAERKFKKWLFESVESEKDVWGIITLVFKLK
ncbi:MAG TPA: energy transducer TonB [bacterium]|nr:energy transducer TonB [bacterium]